MKTAQKPRYRVPTISERIEISLSDFSKEDIREYMREEGETLDGPTAVSFSESDLARFFTLALCGQKSVAVDEILAEVERVMGKRLR